MATQPILRGRPYVFVTALQSMSAPGRYQVNPTLTEGDVKVSQDGGALANLTTLPVVSPAGSVLVLVELSSEEMDADLVTVLFSDPDGEWAEAFIPLQPASGMTLDQAQGFEREVEVPNYTFPMFSTAGVLVSGLTVSAFRRLDDGSVEPCDNTPSEIGSTGLYQIDLSAADRDAEFATYVFTASGAVPTIHSIKSVSR